VKRAVTHPVDPTSKRVGWVVASSLA
jgi:hypothetical protein